MDELDLIRQFAPMVAAPRPEAKLSARAALMAVAVPAPRSRWAWPRSRPVASLGVGALVVAALVIGWPVAFLSRVDPAAAAALQDAAAVAARGEGVDIGDGWVYTRTEAMWGFYAQDWMYLRPLVREVWVAADGSGRIREDAGDPVFLSEADRRAWEAGGFSVYEINEVLGPDSFVPMFGTGSLPTEVEALRAVVRQHAAETHPWGVDGQVFVLVGDLLRDPLTPPAVRASLFEIAASTPGIQLLGEMTDRAGRTGTGVGITRLDRLEILVFDPATSVLLEERTVGLLPYGETMPPVNWGYATYLEERVVSEMPPLTGDETVVEAEPEAEPAN